MPVRKSHRHFATSCSVRNEVSMFDRWKKPHKAVYEVESENLAVPEVHIREDDAAAHDTKEPEAEEEITYENVAIPEIHIKRKQRDK